MLKFTEKERADLKAAGMSEEEIQIIEETEDKRFNDFGYYFGLSYSSYMVLNRSMLEAMPKVWEVKFLALMKEFHEVFEDRLEGTPDSFAVTGKDAKNKFVRDPYANYRHPDKAIFHAVDARYGRNSQD